MILKFRPREQALTDIQIIEGLQKKDASVEKRFFTECRRYFQERKSGVLDIREGAKNGSDLFQDSFLKLWTEIESRKIYIRDNHPWRTDRSGRERKMSASLMTYMMAIAKYKNYENLREEEIYVPELPNMNNQIDEPFDEITPELIVKQCVNELPPRCKEILTLFYYKGKSLDEILEIRKENQSKDGLKSGKSKCMSDLKSRISKEFERHHLNPYPHAQ